MDDGYIKFHCQMEAGPAPDLAAFPGLSRLRTELHDMGVLGVLPDGVGYGNVSALCGGGSEFVITGSATGADRELLDRLWSTVVSVDFGTNTLHCRGMVAASSESMSHAAVYRGHPGIRFVAHIHHAALFAALLRRGWPATPQEAAFGTPEMALSLQKLVSDRGVDAGLVVMGGHEEGILVYATHPEEILRLIWDAFRDSGL